MISLGRPGNYKLTGEQTASGRKICEAIKPMTCSRCKVLMKVGSKFVVKADMVKHSRLRLPCCKLPNPLKGMSFQKP